MIQTAFHLVFSGLPLIDIIHFNYKLTISQLLLFISRIQFVTSLYICLRSFYYLLSNIIKNLVAYSATQQYF